MTNQLEASMRLMHAHLDTVTSVADEVGKDNTLFRQVQQHAQAAFKELKRIMEEEKIGRE